MLPSASGSPGETGRGRTRRKGLPAFLLELTGDRPSLRRVADNVGWILIESAFRLALGMALWIWIARYLGPERFGFLSYAMALVTIVSPLVGLGLEEIAVRELVRAPERRGEILGTALGLKLAGGAAACLAALGAVAVLDPEEAVVRTLVAVLAAGLLFRAAEAFDYHFQSLVLSKYVALARGLGFLLASAGRVAAILAGASLVAFAWAGLAEAVLGAAFLAVFFAGHARGPGRRLSFSARRARSLLGDSWPLLLSSFMILLYMRSDQMMLKHLAAPEELGKYAVAVTFSEAWFLVPMAIVHTLFPKIVEAREVSEAVFHQRLQRLFDLMSGLGWAAALAITLASGPLISRLYGPEYGGAEGMLAVLAWSGIFVALGVARSSYLSTLNWTGFHLFSVLLGAAVNIALNFYFIPRWQGLGAAVTTLIAACVSAYLACFLHRPTVGVGRMMTRALVPLWRRPPAEAP